MKAAAGAVEHVSLASSRASRPCSTGRGAAGLWSVGLAADGPSDVFALDVADAPLVVVLGAEGRGLSRLADARCDLIARIELRGTIESLNVATAAAVACHAVAHRRHG